MPNSILVARPSPSGKDLSALISLLPQHSFLLSQTTEHIRSTKTLITFYIHPQSFQPTSSLIHTTFNYNHNNHNNNIPAIMRSSIIFVAPFASLAFAQGNIVSNLVSSALNVASSAAAGGNSAVAGVISSAAAVSYLSSLDCSKQYLTLTTGCLFGRFIDRRTPRHNLSYTDKLSRRRNRSASRYYYASFCLHLSAIGHYLASWCYILYFRYFSLRQW